MNSHIFGHIAPAFNHWFSVFNEAVFFLFFLLLGLIFHFNITICINYLLYDYTLKVNNLFWFWICIGFEHTIFEYSFFVESLAFVIEETIAVMFTSFPVSNVWRSMVIVPVDNYVSAESMKLIVLKLTFPYFNTWICPDTDFPTKSYHV